MSTLEHTTRGSTSTSAWTSDGKDAGVVGNPLNFREELFSETRTPYLATATCEDRCSKLLPQPQIVSMVPDFNYLTIRKSEDVDARKLSRLASGFDATPRPRIHAPSSPASRYQIALSKDHIDVPF